MSPEAPPVQRQHSGRIVMRVALLVTLGVGLAMLVRSALLDRLAAEPTTPREVTSRGALTPAETSNIALYRAGSPSTVHITTLRVSRDVNLNVSAIPEGTGSGFMWDKEGHIVTNMHVIRQADAARVTLSDQSVYRAELVGVAEDKDLAVLKIAAPAELLHPIPLGSSHDLQVGQAVYAIGNPFGLDQTLTTGIISGLGREIRAETGRPIQDVIQTDAAINPGNSGGPLLDSAGRLIGVTTAIVSPSGAYAGVGFAVPVDTVNRIVPQLIQHRHVVRPVLGINIAQDAIARRLGKQGVIVLAVQAGGPAAIAGLKSAEAEGDGGVKFDLITAIDGKAVRSGNDLYNALDRHDVGDVVKVTFEREGVARIVDCKLQGAK